MPLTWSTRYATVATCRRLQRPGPALTRTFLMRSNRKGLLSWWQKDNVHSICAGGERSKECGGLPAARVYIVSIPGAPSQAVISRIRRTWNTGRIIFSAFPRENVILTRISPKIFPGDKGGVG